MAKQNFLGGGYTGKLGATIGQRWKNAYTVRTYTKPTNPQTPAQQANRGAFGGAVFFAQLGNQMNYKSPAFDTANNTEWAYRMSAAKINIQNSLTDLAIIPIVPQNFTTSPTVSGISLKNIVANTSIEFELTLSSGVGAKSYSLMLYFAEGSREGEYLLLRGSTTAAEPTKLICPCANTATIGQVEVYALIVSTDDTVPETIAYSARVPLVNASKPAFAQTVSITSVTSDNAGGFVVAAQMGVYGADLVGNFTNGGILSKGNYKTKAAVRAAASEAAATTTPAIGLEWNVSNWSVNTTTGVITFTARPTNYAAINTYELTEFRMALTWTNAYNDLTEMSSGSCQGATTTTPTYTQPAFTAELSCDTYRTINNSATQFLCDFDVDIKDASIVGDFGWDLSNAGLSYASKDAVFAAGSESDAERTQAEQGAFTFTQQSYNRATGVLTMLFTLTNGEQINNIDEWNYSPTPTFTKMYSDNYRVGSGVCEDADISNPPEYLQAAFTPSLVITNGCYQAGEEITDNSCDGWLTLHLNDAASIAAAQGASFDGASIVKMSGNYAFVGRCDDGTQANFINNAEDNNLDDFDGTTFEFIQCYFEADKNIGDKYLEQGTAYACVLRMCFNEDSDTPCGLYDASHRWGAFPDLTIAQGTPVRI